ncbi:hypothetical protein PhaeoP75_04466 (plasmid) [Phaeobacter gallaeciensis]|uniref:Uncharacterized protein n=1 Tax=Phaeobacter gallaeciensis TaxID=60890 RepID=A0AAC9ZD37_9RHOB|nr:hypothetical protein [Phaeobacter gallaeciensis]ATF04065.1 hypothetical protein PhaeoP75_04466 [Phaeobacter gallaeciensis]ATF08341.1 hypothetical protein PhaeoP63_04311 [Phaeobacter gallaeciensis]
MTRYSYRTPGTALWWSNVAEWCACAHRLDQRRSSGKRNCDLETHGGCMPLAMIAIEDDLEAIEAAIWLLTRGPAYLIRPQRGSRADHPTTPIIVALNNRAAILKREADNMPRGANWTAVHGPN